MFKKTIPAAVVVVLSLSAGVAAADQTFHPSKGEDGTIMHVVPGTKSRAQVDAEQIATAQKDISADAWRYVGGETGWKLVQHAYNFHKGKWVHADKLDHSTPKPSLTSIEQARKLNRDQYSGA